MTEYKVEYGLYNDEGTEIPVEVRNRIQDRYIGAVEDEGLWTGGGIRVYTRLDIFLGWLWIQLWRVKWLRKEYKEEIDND